MQPEANQFTLADLLACVAREVAMRKSCYPKWEKVDDLSKLSSGRKRELALMKAVGARLEAVAAAQEKQATPAAPLADAELAEFVALQLPCELQLEENLDDTADIVGVYEGGTTEWVTGRMSLKKARSIVGIVNALPGLLARLAAAEAHSATLQSALESAAETNRVLAERLKTIADALPGIAKNLTDAVGAADTETDNNGTGNGYEHCYNECDNAAAALRKVLRELNPTVKGGQPSC